MNKKLIEMFDLETRPTFIRVRWYGNDQYDYLYEVITFTTA